MYLLYSGVSTICILTTDSPISHSGDGDDCLSISKVLEVDLAAAGSDSNSPVIARHCLVSHLPTSSNQRQKSGQNNGAIGYMYRMVREERDAS